MLDEMVLETAIYKTNEKLKQSRKQGELFC